MECVDIFVTVPAGAEAIVLFRFLAFVFSFVGVLLTCTLQGMISQHFDSIALWWKLKCPVVLEYQLDILESGAIGMLFLIEE